jgi:vancomycin resistance protein YoaR
MFAVTEKKERKENYAFFLFSALFLIIVMGCGVATYQFEKKYQDKILPGVKIGNVNLEGKTLIEAKKILSEESAKISQAGITFNYQDNIYVLPSIISSLDNDFAYQLIIFDPEATANNAWKYGRDNEFIPATIQLFNKLISRAPSLSAKVEINQEEIKKNLIENFHIFEKPAEESQIKILSDGANPIIDFTDEKLGIILNFDQVINQLQQNLNILNGQSIVLSAQTDYPKEIFANKQEIISQATIILAKAPLTIFYQDKQWLIEQEELALWLQTKNNNTNKVYVGLNNEVASKFIQDKISPEVDIKPIEPRFSLESGKVTEFQKGQDGLEINLALTLSNIENELILGAENSVELVMTTTQPLSELNDASKLGIKEIIGTGYSKYTGSPVNRRYNIKNGAKSLAGIIIKPDEEFSLATSLGEITKETGYLPEMVIKGNKTIPEYGGGLCQIATTLFRAALSSGLPITERRNHSYRVGYYEPAGTDAAIYPPHPDVKFINDTGNNILIQYRLSEETSELYFDFWGTKDGRNATSTKPVIYNLVKPAPTKIIETTDLKPGQKKCTERAHTGADAYFNYQVTYPNGELKEKKFTSHYVPWQEVCLVGVAQLSTSTATSTPITATSTTATTSTAN